MTINQLTLLLGLIDRRSRNRRRLASATLAGLTALIGGAASSSDAIAGPTLLIDGGTGTVIYSEMPDQKWFPASLTKLMTAYITFDAIKSGKLTMETKVPLSELARAQPATRIGLKVGIELSVEQAVRGLILRSANDFAMALAELIGGSEEGFAVTMNATAKRLGMTRSHFKNPHGLPDPEQYTTARDMALLATAIHRDFPERSEIFSTMQFVIHKGTFHSQNDLLRTVAGADGMKTGFTCGAGYNVVASASRDGRRIIAVVMGEALREQRSQRATALLEHGFAAVAWKEALGAPKLPTLGIEAGEADAVSDMSKATLARQCGNRVRVARQMMAQARAVRPGAPAGTQAVAQRSSGKAGGSVVPTNSAGQ